MEFDPKIIERAVRIKRASALPLIQDALNVAPHAINALKNTPVGPIVAGKLEQHLPTLTSAAKKVWGKLPHIAKGVAHSAIGAVENS